MTQSARPEFWCKSIHIVSQYLSVLVLSARAHRAHARHMENAAVVVQARFRGHTVRRDRAYMEQQRQHQQRASERASERRTAVKTLPRQPPPHSWLCLHVFAVLACCTVSRWRSTDLISG